MTNVTMDLHSGAIAFIFCAGAVALLGSITVSILQSVRENRRRMAAFRAEKLVMLERSLAEARRLSEQIDYAISQGTVDLTTAARVRLHNRMAAIEAEMAELTQR